MSGRNLASSRHAGSWRIGLLAGLVVGALGLTGCSLRDAPLLRNLMSWPVAPEQHSEQAGEYRKQAEEAQRLAAYHGAMAGKYRAAADEGDAETRELNQRMARHCAALVEAYKAAAVEYEALASGQESLAASLSTQP